MIPGENNSLGDTFFYAVRYISKGSLKNGVLECWSVGMQGSEIALRGDALRRRSG
jgi:hypothetical protein